MATETQGLPELMDGITEGGASSKTKGVLQGAKEALFGDEDEGDEDEGKGSTTKRRSSSTTAKRRRSGGSSSGSSQRRSKSS